MIRETPYFDRPYFRGRCWIDDFRHLESAGRGEHGHEAVQLAVEPNLEHHFAAEALEAAIVIVQHARRSDCSPAN